MILALDLVRISASESAPRGRYRATQVERVLLPKGPHVKSISPSRYTQHSCGTLYGQWLRADLSLRVQGPTSPRLGGPACPGLREWERKETVKEEASGGAERSEFRSKYLKLSNPHFPHLYKWTNDIDSGSLSSTQGSALGDW